MTFKDPYQHKRFYISIDIENYLTLARYQLPYIATIRIQVEMQSATLCGHLLHYHSVPWHSVTCAPQSKVQQGIQIRILGCVWLILVVQFQIEQLAEKRGVLSLYLHCQHISQRWHHDEHSVVPVLQHESCLEHEHDIPKQVYSLFCKRLHLGTNAAFHSPRKHISLCSRESQ